MRVPVLLATAALLLVAAVNAEGTERVEPAGRPARAAATPAAGPGGPRRGTPRPAAPLQRLQRLLIEQGAQPASSNTSATLVRLSKEMVKGLAGKGQNQQPPVAVSASALSALAKAAAQAATPVHRGQVLVERGRLLQLVGKAEQAEAAVEEAAGLFGDQLAEWAASEAAGDDDGDTGDGSNAPGSGPGSLSLTPSSSRRQQAASALSSLLDVSGVLRQLGREERANGLLADAVRLAPQLASTASYLRGVAQLSALTDEQLEAVVTCVALVEQRQREAEGSGEGGEEGGEGSTGGGCDWMRPAVAAGSNKDKPKPVPDLHRLYYAAHRGLHARKRYHEAFVALAEAKRLHKAKHNYTDKNYTKSYNDILALFPLPGQEAEAQAEAAEAAQAGGHVASSPGSRAEGAAAAEEAEEEAGSVEGDAHVEMIPIFVVGMPRSGSTLIEQILASHPDVWGSGEHSSLRPVTNKLLDYIAKNGSVAEAQLGMLRRRYLAAMRSKIPPDRRGATWLVDKALSNAWLVGHIALMMPRACVVHAVRHPADTALSSFQQSFFPDKVPWSFNLTHIANHVNAHHRVMAHWDRALPGRVLHLHYSEMVTDQEGTTRHLIEHCGLPWHPSFLRFYETQRSVQTASQLQVKKPIYSSSLNKWPPYAEDLAPLLLQIRETILRYEEQAGLPSSLELLDRLAQQQQQQQQKKQQQQASGAQEEEHSRAAAAVAAVAAAAEQERDTTAAVSAEAEAEADVGEEEQGDGETAEAQAAVDAAADVRQEL